MALAARARDLTYLASRFVKKLPFVATYLNDLLWHFAASPECPASGSLL
jgi:hypothetical protein